MQNVIDTKFRDHTEILILHHSHTVIGLTGRASEFRELHQVQHDIQESIRVK